MKDKHNQLEWKNKEELKELTSLNKCYKCFQKNKMNTIKEKCSLLNKLQKK